MMNQAEKNEEPMGRIFNWLGLKKAADKSAFLGAERRNAWDSRNLSKEARRALAQSIMDFLLDNDLEITPLNLSIAHAAFSGADPRVARTILARQQSGDPITQAWLNELSHAESAPADCQQQDLDKLMQRLENQVENFQAQTRQARKFTVQYGSELEQHVVDLEGLDRTGDLVTDLAGLASAMLERTQKAEQEMRRSEEEVRSLRRNLARARRDAEIDHLTGLPNRRAFEALLSQQYKDARDNAECLSIAFCDIDNFKRINDEHGHDAGDRVIKVIAETLALISDDRCHVARHGGEEFVMLFRGLNPHQAFEKLDQARAALAERKLVNRNTDTPFGKVTFSGGLANVFGYPNVRDALRAADGALYRAKDNGRNRIELA
jgi:diguanylate cyclase